MESEFLSLYLYKDFWSIAQMNQAKQLVYDIENENKKWILTIMSTDDFIFDNYYYEKEEFLLEDVTVLEDKGIEMIPLYETQTQQPAHTRFCEIGDTFELVKRPKVKLIGENGNVFNLLGICVKALKKEGMKDEALELTTKVFHSTSYEEALEIMNQYCETY